MKLVPTSFIIKLFLLLYSRLANCQKGRRRQPEYQQPVHKRRQQRLLLVIYPSL